MLAHDLVSSFLAQLGAAVGGAVVAGFLAARQAQRDHEWMDRRTGSERRRRERRAGRDRRRP